MSSHKKENDKNNNNNINDNNNDQSESNSFQKFKTKSSFLLSDINSKRFQNIIDFASINIKEIRNSELLIRKIDYNKENPIPVYQWNNEQSENEQIPSIINWFNTNIPLPNNDNKTSTNFELVYRDVHHHSNLLYTSRYIEFLPYSLNGTVSLIVCPPNIRLLDKQIHILIEVKKQSSFHHVQNHSGSNFRNFIQTSICQLLASLTHVKDNNPIILILTDLHDIWYFFWFSNASNVTINDNDNSNNDEFKNLTIFKNYKIEISFTNTNNRNEAKFLINFILYRVFNIRDPIYKWGCYKFSDSLKKILNPLVLDPNYNKKYRSSPSCSSSIWNFIKKYLIPCI
ncbi:hypothetical protein RB653_003616 [Dictyostelium firmibasis]|uniref:Uncharacterized protein n=1 Tax=Dictyostelium firmibasis TaxID=79012 RepID=A0AAN7YRS5_9MYCE